MQTDWDDLTKHVWVPILKTVDHDDGSVTVVGRPTTGEVDFDGQIMDPDFVKEKFPQWFNEWGNIRVMHRPEAVGVGTDLAWDDQGPIMAAKIVEPTAVKLVKEGVYKGFSVGVAHVRTKYDANAPKGRIYDGEFFETSLVDKPSASGARFVIAKTAGAEWAIDTQTGEVHKMGDVRDPNASNSGDVDSQGNPILQPGHVQDNAARVQIVTMDDSRIIARLGDQEWVVPYTVNSAAEIVFGEPEPYPHDAKAQTDDPRNFNGEVQKGTHALQEVSATARNKPTGSLEAIRDQVLALLDPPDFNGRRSYDIYIIATYPDAVVFENDLHGKYYRVGYRIKDGSVELTGEPEQVEQTFVPIGQGTATKAAGAAQDRRRALMAELGKAVWSTAYIDSLPGSAFAYVAPGGTKDDRHLPYKDKDGKIDADHVRNALARLDQTDISSAAKADARRKLESAAKEVGIDVNESTEAKKTALLNAAQAALDNSAFCPHCKSAVQLGDGPREVKKVADAQGSVVSARGVCGHVIHKFVKDDHRGHDHQDTQHCPTCREAVKVAEHQADHTECKGACGHVVKCAEEADAAKGVDSGNGDGAKENGGEVGTHHADEGGAESQERDIARRMRTAIDQYDKANTGEGGAEEGAENRALAQLRELVNAAIAQQQREAVDQGRQDATTEGENKGAGTEPVQDGGTVAGGEAEEDKIAKIAAALGYDGALATKAARKIKGERLERLKALHGTLGDLISELQHVVADEPQGDATTKGAGFEPNGGAAPVAYDPKAKKPKDVLERIRTGIRELDELLGVIARGEGMLDGGEPKAGDLGPDAKPVADTDPSRQTIDLTRGDGSDRLVAGAGKDLSTLEHVVTKAAQTAVAGVEQSVDVAVKGALAPLVDAVSTLTHRLETVEHMAAPMTRAEAYIAQERTHALDSTHSRAQQQAREDLKRQIAALPATEREQFAARVLQAGGLGRI